MNDYNVLNVIYKLFARFKEELGLSSTNLLLSKLRFTIFPNWILDDAVLILSKHHDSLLFDKLLLSINNMDIFD